MNGIEDITSEEALVAGLQEDIAAARAAQPATTETAKSGNDVPGAAEETPPADEAAEVAEEGVESDVPSQDENQESEEAGPEETGTEDPAGAEAAPTEREPRFGEVVDDLEGLDPAQRKALKDAASELVRNRIAKEKAKRASLEAEVETLRSKLAESADAPPVVAPSVDNPFSSVKTRAGLEAEAAKFERLKDAVDDLLPELAINPQAVEQALRSSKRELKDADGNDDYSPTRMRAELERIKANAERNLNRHIPKALKQLEERQRYDAEAIKSFPMLKDSEHGLTQAVNRFLRDHPEIAAWPYGRLLAARALRDEALEKAALAKPKSPAPLPPPKAKAKPNLAPGTPVKPAASHAASAALIAAQKEFDETGSLASLTRLEALERAGRPSRK